MYTYTWTFQMVHKGCRLTIPEGLIDTPWKVLVYIYILIDCFAYMYISKYTYIWTFIFMFRNPQVNISWPFGRSISNHVLWFWVVPPWVVALRWTLPWNIPRSATDCGGVEEQGADDGCETHWRQSGNWQKQDNWVRARVNISHFVWSKVWYVHCRYFA